MLISIAAGDLGEARCGYEWNRTTRCDHAFSLVARLSEWTPVIAPAAREMRASSYFSVGNDGRCTPWRVRLTGAALVRITLTVAVTAVTRTRPTPPQGAKARCRRVCRAVRPMVCLRL